eukprot:gene7865-8504_t
MVASSMLISILLLIILSFQFEVDGTNWIYIRKDLKRRFELFRLRTFTEDEFRHVTKTIAHNNTIGYVTCSANKHLPEVVRTIYALRLGWKSYRPITIMHCNELAPDVIDIILNTNIFNNIEIMDICSDENQRRLNIVGNGVAYQLLRGYYCKIASLILSPYEHTILMDLDLVWFKSPEIGFNSIEYRETGSLFFRERVITKPTYDYYSKQLVNVIHLLWKNWQAYNISLTSEYVKEQYFKQRTPSIFWKCFPHLWPKEDPGYDHCPTAFQDSSMVYLHKSRHPKMIEVLTKLLPTFEGTIGDQDIYWVAATLANESFAFSPYEASQYGDCQGYLLHPDPNDYYRGNQSRQEPSLFYMNAEYLVENSKKVHSVGEYLRDVMIAPSIVSYNNYTLPSQNQCFLLPPRYTQCTCKSYKCIQAPQHIAKYIVYHQWIILSFRIKRHRYEYQVNNITEIIHEMKQCMHTYINAFPALNEVIKDRELFHPDDCYAIGCPLFPLQLTEKNESAWLPSAGRLCDPVFFAPSTELSNREVNLLQRYAPAFRRPIVSINTPVFSTKQLILCIGERSIFMLHSEVNGGDNKFHEFPDYSTFLKMGFHVKQVLHIPYEVCHNLKFGDPLPSLG